MPRFTVVVKLTLDTSDVASATTIIQARLTSSFITRPDPLGKDGVIITKSNDPNNVSVDDVSVKREGKNRA